jgi:hypothetical protein
MHSFEMLVTVTNFRQTMLTSTGKKPTLLIFNELLPFASKKVMPFFIPLLWIKGTITTCFCLLHTHSLQGVLLCKSAIICMGIFTLNYSLNSSGFVFRYLYKEQSRQAEYYSISVHSNQDEKYYI